MRRAHKYPPQLDLQPSSINVLVLLREAGSGISQRPGRSILTAIGTVLGVGSLVAILGLTSSANGQVSKQFTELEATQVTVTPAPGDSAAAMFAPTAVDSARHINGVTDAATYVPLNSPTVTAASYSDSPSPQTDNTNVLSVSQSFWNASGTTVYGRLPTGYLSTQDVAIVGRALADVLGINSVAGQPTIRINGVPFTVIGIETSATRVPDSLLSVMIPDGVARRDLGKEALDQTNAKMLVTTRVGAVTRVAEQLPRALDAATPNAFEALAPSQQRGLQQQISRQLQQLFLLVGAVLLLVGAFSILNTNLVAVLERVPEIGLRRAVGARPRHVAAQFVLESLILGAFGGVIGTSLGVLAVVWVSVAQGWTAILPAYVVPCGPLLGTATGVLAGLYPALRASRIEPVSAFRR